MSKIRLSETQYLEAVNRLLAVWIAAEPMTANPIPKTARAVLFAALNLIREHARRGERVAVVAGVQHIATWLLEHEAPYKSPRDILYHFRRKLRDGNTRGAEQQRLRRLFPSHPLTFFGVQVEVGDAPPHLRLQVWVTAGTKTSQDRVPVLSRFRDIPLIEPPPSLDDPMEAILIAGLLHIYRKRGQLARYESVARHRRLFDIKLPDLRNRALRALTAILRRRYTRRYGSLEIGDLTKVQRIALEVWYRWALTRWESSAWEHTIHAGSATHGALARKLQRDEGPKHPDELLAEAAQRERTAALQFWALDRVKQTKAEIAQMEQIFERAAQATAPALNQVIFQLHELGAIDDIEAWGDRELTSYQAMEEEAVALAEERGMPPPVAQRAIRRLARPRVHSWPEREARKIVTRGPAADNAEELLRRIIEEYLKLMNVPRLDGGLELYLENQLRFFMTIHRLIVQRIADTDAARLRQSSKQQP